ncbi:hypothetical protein [Virgisporangium aurantiacum]|uniref:hypothetical protein n=1 Tax=Virgisporangium aurantiacum TaxID=175570 RepID=UPI00194E753F|nr:hypothetical protein [Virgisporangium aurantiacum]
MDWNELLWHTERRLGMYVGRLRYDRAYSMVTGFDLARGQGDLARFQVWMAERHGDTALAWPSLVLKEVFGNRAGEESLRTDEDHQIAIEHLCERLREFLNLPENDPR